MSQSSQQSQANGPSLIELKAIAFDLISSIESCQANLRKINQSIAQEKQRLIMAEEEAAILAEEASKKAIEKKAADKEAKEKKCSGPK